MNTHKKSFSEAVADWYWDFMDVNSNLSMAEYVARSTVPNGGQAGLNFFMMLLIVLPLSILAAWHFDFHSTYDGMTVFITEIMTSVSPIIGMTAPADPTQATKWVATITAIISIIVTVAPTVMELFVSNFARSNITVIKIFVLGASAFDVITDIPTTKAWVDKFIPTLDTLGPIIGFVMYWIVFFIWLALATVGFQLSVVIFGYTTYIYLVKWTDGTPAAKYIPKPASFNKASNAAQVLKTNNVKKPVSNNGGGAQGTAAEVTIIARGDD